MHPTIFTITPVEASFTVRTCGALEIEEDEVEQE
jgi:hypothetical protein